jgi:hypothetical protein
MGPADVLADADWMQAQLNDPDLMPAEVDEYEPKSARSHRLCSCHHGRDAHRHYRPGSDCAACSCPRWSPPNPVLRLVRRWAR